MLRRARSFISLIVAALIGSCAPLVTKPPEKEVKAPEKRTLEKIPEAPENRFAEMFVQRGREKANNGDLVAALKQYNLALTVDPLHHEALEGQNRLKSALDHLAEEHYQEGLKLQRQGKYGLARHQFLISLRLRPDYPEVINMLTSRKRIQIKRYLVHTIKEGESLSQVAKIYYGDSSKFPVLARYNNITDATKVYVGQEIKVPEIEGMEFQMEEAALDVEEMEVAGLGSWGWEEGYAHEALKEDEAPERKAEEREREREEQAMIYRDQGLELFEKQQYQEAVVEFTKVLNAYPEDPIAFEYCYKSHFQNAMTLFENKDYLAARDQFQACLQYKGDCQECHRHIKASEDLYKALHYKRGIQFYNKELLYEAITEWELVKALDPKYKRIEYLIDKSKTILKNIEALQRDQKEGPKTP
jgi:tetratricopeptide (TPR) repeat protein